MPNPTLSSARDVAKRTGGFFNGFKEFIARGNAIELAVGIVIGAAFTGSSPFWWGVWVSAR